MVMIHWWGGDLDHQYKLGIKAQTGFWFRVKSKPELSIVQTGSDHEKNNSVGGLILQSQAS